MARAWLETSGFGDIRKTLSAVARGVPDVTETAVMEVSERILEESQGLVPVDTGLLRSSGYALGRTRRSLKPNAKPPAEVVAQAARRGGMVPIIVGYGVETDPRAIVQHERTDYRHRMGRAKYLEIPFRRHTPNLPRVLAKHHRRFLQRRGRRVGSDFPGGAP